MDLFTYLMAKNGNNTSVHGDLFSYLLGKGQSQTYTVSGTTIYIPDAKKLVSFMMTKESTQDNIAYVNVGEWEQGNINASTGANESNTTRVRTKDYIPIKSGVLYTLTRTIATSFNTYRFYDSSKNYIGSNVDVDMTSSLTTKNMISESTQQITINNTNVAYLRIVDVSNNLNTIYTISTENTPSPDYPQEVNVVEGYRNLFDKDNTGNLVGYGLSGTNGGVSKNNERNTSYFIELKPNTNYYLSGATFTARVLYNENQGFIKNVPNGLFTTTEDTKYMRFGYVNTVDYSKIKLTEGDQELPYVPYGNNYVAVNVSDGNTTNSYPIPLNNNELVGIGDYKDELKVDKSGHVFINKKTGKVVFDGSESWSLRTNDGTNYVYSITSITDYLFSSSILGLSNYFSKVRYTSSYANALNNGIGIYFYYSSGSSSRTLYVTTNTSTTSSDFQTWLSTHNTDVYYPLATPELIDLQTTVDLKLFKGVNNVSNSEDANMTIEYR